MHYYVSAGNTGTVSLNAPYLYSINQVSLETNSIHTEISKTTTFSNVDRVRGTHQE